MNAPSKDLKQLGWCETCGDVAYSIRHTYKLVIESDRVYSRPVEHHMCIRHKMFYFAHMEAEKAKLEAKTGTASQKGCR
jgi:hypothetical protein